MKTPTLEGLNEKFDERFPELFRRVTEPAKNKDDFGKIIEFDMKESVRAFYHKKMLKILKYLEIKKKEEKAFSINFPITDEDDSLWDRNKLIELGKQQGYNQAVKEFNKLKKEIKG